MNEQTKKSPRASDLDAGFPRSSVRLALASMVVVALASSIVTWIVSKRIQTITTSQVQVLTGIEQLQRQSQVLELYTRLVVGTGDDAFARRYGELQPQLRRTLDQLKASIQLPENRATFVAVQAAEREIAATEYQALDLAVEDRREEARAILEAPRYRALVGTYRSGLSSIGKRASAYVQSTRSETAKYLNIILASSLVALLLVAFVWAVLVRPARNWAIQLADARYRAERATRAKSNFLAMMSHEIRTPLNSIIGFAEMLLADRELRPHQRRQVELVQTAGGMLLTVVNDILDYSALEAGKIELVQETFALETLIDNSISIIRGAADAKGLAINVSIDADVATYFRSDEGRIRQVLLNLLNNAVKFTASGSISLMVRSAGRMDDADVLRFEVADTGAGIEPNQQGRLFKPFNQANPTVHRHFGGTGLGLSISKHLVEMLGGRIGFESTPGEGSTFWFEVPLRDVDEPASASREQDAAEISGARILLAEDLPMNQELALAMLTRRGHQVDIAPDGAAAVEALKSREYDLILMDIQMPNMDGVTATRRIREMGGKGATVPILAMTANVLPHQVREFLRAGMNGHIAKPVHQDQLDASIAAAIGTRSHGQANGSRLEAAGDEAVFEGDTFENVAAILPPERLEQHLQSLAAEGARVTALNAAADRAEIQASSHKIVSQAGMLGLARLSARARDLEEACSSKDQLDEEMHRLRDALADVELPVSRCTGR